MSRAWRNGSTRRWRRLRQFILERDGWRCRAHDDGWCDVVPGSHACTGRANHVHHTRGKAITGDDVRFLIAACSECNRHIGEPGKHSPQPKRISKW